jgi:sulfonate transport system ATP-binding protein
MPIRLRAVRKTFPRRGEKALVVLDGVSLVIDDGSLFTLIGPSGCGKTTLLKLIAGIEDVDDGQVEITGVPGESIPIIWQEHRLFPWRTVLRNVTLPLELRKVSISEANERARDLLQLMRLEKFENDYPWQLSGGMAQQLAIARGLAANAKCLLMDEPFASVDYQTKQRLFQQLKEIQKQAQLTIVYVTHDLRDAIQYSDSIAVFTSRPGRVKEVIKPTSRDIPHSELETHLWQALHE